MAHQNYFTSSAANPVELAEKNLPFYDEFVASWGCSSVYRDLWPGQNLAAFIYSFDSYAKQLGRKVLTGKAKQLKSKYSSLYRQLTGHRYTNHSPRSTGLTY